MSPHYVLIYLQKNDAWAPGCTRNPETYILKDQVSIPFVPLTFFCILTGLSVSLSCLKGYKKPHQLVARKYAHARLVIMPTSNCCIYGQKKNIGISVEVKIENFILRNRVNYKRNLSFRLFAMCV